MPAPAINPAIDGLSLPPVPAIQQWARAYSGDKGPLIDLSQAVPGYRPHDDLLRWLGDAASAPSCAGYGPIEGDDLLRQVYAAHVSQVYGTELQARNIHVTAGCNQAFAVAALAVAGPGDTVLLTNPYYFNHETTLRMFSIRAGLVECRSESAFLPGPALIADALRPGVRALALASPNNPTGAVYPPDLLAEILSICVKKGVWLILDETYRDFLPAGAGPAHDLFSHPRWQQGLIQLYSFSKSYCIPGHRVGAVAAAPAVIGQIAKIMDNLQICAPRPPQAALARAIPALGGWRAENAREIERRAVALKETMAGLPGWEIGAIGAYFAYIRHPFRGRASAQVAEHLARRAGIVCIPGDYFGIGQQDYLRFAFANAEAPTIRMLRERLEAFAL